MDVHRVRRRRVRVQRGARQPSHLSASRRKSPSRRFQTEHDRRPRRRRSERPSSALRALRRFMARRSRRRRRDGVHLPLRARKPRQRVDDDVRARRRGSVGVRRRRRIRLRDDVPSLVVRRRRRVHVRVRGPRDVRGPRGRRGYPRGVLRARDGHSPRGGGVFFTLARRSTFDVRRARDGRRTRESRAVSRSRRAVRGVSRRVPPRVSLLQTRIRRVVRVAVSLGETRARRGAGASPRRDPRPDRARGGDETRGRVTRRSDAKERIVGDDAVRPGDGLPVVVRRGPPVRRGGGPRGSRRVRERRIFRRRVGG